MTMVFDANRSHFTSDLHLFHKRMIDRNDGIRKQFGFTINDMHEHIIAQWNKQIPHNGQVFILGDLTFGPADLTVGVLGQLNGEKHLIRGNHDRKLKPVVRDMFHSVHDLLEIDVLEPGGTKQRIIMCHFGMRVWNKHHYGSWHLYGHSHGSLPGIGRSMDVGLDTTEDLSPYSYWGVAAKLGYINVHQADYHVSPSRIVLED